MTNTYDIIENHGYGFTTGAMMSTPLATIEAKSAQEARKIFEKKWNGHPILENPTNYRATKVS